MLTRHASTHSVPNSTSTDWATQEFAHAALSDQRLVQRLISLATDLALQPTAPIPQACGSWAKTKAAYRFFDNDTIAPEDLLNSHTQATIQRAAAHPLVLCPQDTTTLNYSTHPQTQGLGPIGNNRDKTIGLLLHSTLAHRSDAQSAQERVQSGATAIEAAARRRRVVAVDLVVAWRVLALCRAGRETPAGLASDWLSGAEWRALWCYLHEKKSPPRRVPSVREAVRWIARLGGFLGRRRDGDPGPVVVWGAIESGGQTPAERGVHAASPWAGSRPSELTKASGGRALKRRERRAPARHFQSHPVVWRGLHRLKDITATWRLFQGKSCG